LRLEVDFGFNEALQEALDPCLPRYSPPREWSPGKTSTASSAKLVRVGPMSPPFMARTERRIM
jgi:hypothetical protein